MSKEICGVDDIHIILVHGTFSTSAVWAAEESKFRKVLSATLKESKCNYKFHVVDWDGNNVVTSRRLASLAIQSVISSLPPSAKFLLIGHSHGGSAISYLLKTRADLGERLAGVVYMSTPFIALRLRRRVPDTLIATSFLWGLGVYVAIGVFFGWLEWQLSIPANFPYLVPINLFASILIGLYIIQFLLKRRRLIVRADSLYMKRLNMTAQEQDTCDLPFMEQSIFIRTTGDEASAALSFIQFLSLIALKIGDITDGVISSSVRYLEKFVAYWPTFFLLVGSLATIQIWIIYYARICLSYGEFLSPGDAFSGYHINFIFINNAFTQGSSDILAFPGITIGALFILISILMFFTILIRGSISTITLFAFGVTYFRYASLLDLAVEPAPYGASNLHHVQWPTQGEEEAPLNHSNVYSNQSAVELIGHWILDRTSNLSS
ncbi:esterase/lipase family protein [Salinarimonas soli]|uniref:AB hydrolase-1 domain-containing protein n=1 Tax=Salinarimonas soli TaxID=1638099 RepID=A0A5B2VCC1_9HYPH|nr:alpha/beta hydrolase [Salinarimonas soli]KAA2235757.1 hypothetical protein F0L46_18205 [Salinarimonas soli]